MEPQKLPGSEIKGANHPVPGRKLNGLSRTPLAPSEFAGAQPALGGKDAKLRRDVRWASSAWPAAAFTSVRCRNPEPVPLPLWCCGDTAVPRRCREGTQRRLHTVGREASFLCLPASINSSPKPKTAKAFPYSSPLVPPLLSSLAPLTSVYLNSSSVSSCAEHGIRADRTLPLERTEARPENEARNPLAASLTQGRPNFLSL